MKEHKHVQLAVKYFQTDGSFKYSTRRPILNQSVNFPLGQRLGAKLDSILCGHHQLSQKPSICAYYCTA